MYNFSMRRKTNDIDAVTILVIALLVPLILWWKVVVAAVIITIILRIFWNILKKIYDIDETQNSVRSVSNINDSGNWQPVYYNSPYETAEDKYVVKGLEAEEKIVRILRKIFSSWNIIHDSYFRDDELVTTQVDVVVIDETGIYVIESKAYSGVIKGKQKDKSWVQLFANKKYTRFSNPINQNNRHIEAIKRNLVSFELPDEVFKSYIVFSDNCKLDVELEQDSNIKVIKQNELFYTILEDKRNLPKLITTKKVEDISRRIYAHSRIDESIKEAHIDRRKNNIKYDINK